MEPSTANSRGLFLAGLLSLLAARELVPQEPGPSGRGPEILVALHLQDGSDTLGALGRALGPVPAGLPLEFRAGLGLAWLGLSARLGRSPEQLVNLLVPGPGVLAVVVRDGRPVPVFASRVLDPQAVSSLLEEFPDIPAVLRGEILAVSTQRSALDAPLPHLFAPDGRGGLAVDAKELRRAVEQCFLAILSRPPSATELQRMLPELDGLEMDDAIADLRWSLLNSAEFRTGY